MRGLTRIIFGLLLAGMAVIAPGCGGDAASGPEGMPSDLSEVYGVVQQKGRPVSGQESRTLQFQPVSGGETLTVGLSEDGTYSITVPRNAEFNVQLLGPDSQPIGEPTRITATEPMNDVTIDVAGSGN